MRYCDDIVDETGAPDDKRAGLSAWRRLLAQAYRLPDGVSHPILPAFRDTVQRFAIPQSCFEAIIDGAEMDLDLTRYRTFDALREYCYRVASAVGLVCIHIFGFSGGDQACRYAESCGLAFQLTNILRDIPEDAQMGRIYLPQEDLEDFSFTEDDIRCGVATPDFRRLMQFEVERAHGYYREALPLIALVHPSSRACLSAMIRIYWQHLYEIERRNYDVFGPRIRLPAWKKLAIAAGAIVRKRV